MSWTFGYRGMQMAGALFIGVVVVRYLGAQRFGELNFAIAFASIFGAIASLGLDGVVVRNIVSDEASAPTIVGTGLVLKLAASVVSIAAAGLAILPVRHDQSARWLVVILATGTLFNAFDIFDFWFQARVDARSVAYSRGAAFIIASAAKISLVVMHARLFWFAVVGSAELAAAALGLVIAYHLAGARLMRLRWSGAAAASMLRDSWPLIFSNVMILIYMRIDQVMLGTAAGDREVGIYSVAVRLAEVWVFIPAALIATVFPSVVQARQVSDEAFYGRLQKLYDSVSVLCYAIAIPVTIAGPWVIRVLYGEEYAAAGPVLIVLVWSIHFTALGMARSAFLTTINRTGVHTLTVCAGAVVNVGLNLWLIPRYGALGAAIASLLAYGVAAYGACFVYPPLFRTARMLTKAIVFPRPA